MAAKQLTGSVGKQERSETGPVVPEFASCHKLHLNYLQ